MGEEKKVNKGWANLRTGEVGFQHMDKAKLREVSRKGNAKMRQIVQERKSAKKCLEDILTLECTDEIIAGAELDPLLAEQLKKYADKITLYDLVQLVATGAAIGGNMRAAEYIRDTAGDAPVKQMNIDGLEIMTEADREMIKQISELLNRTDIMIAYDATEDTTADGEEGNKTDNGTDDD